jgi:hypothetical protein
MDGRLIVHLGGRGRVDVRVVGIVSGGRVSVCLVGFVSVFVSDRNLGLLAASEVEHPQNVLVGGVCFGESLA